MTSPATLHPVSTPTAPPPATPAPVIPVTLGRVLTASQEDALARTPWGWRTGTVRAVSERLTCIDYDDDLLPAPTPAPSHLAEPAPTSARVICWHAKDLRPLLRPGDVVAVHEEHHALRVVVDHPVNAVRTLSAYIECGLGPVPAPSTD